MIGPLPGLETRITLMETFEDNFMQPGTSRPPFNHAGDPEVDTAWITRLVLSPGYRDHYSVDAHELLHVLADTGHSVLRSAEDRPARPQKGEPSDEPDRYGGLMAGNPLIRSDVVDPSLCEKMRAHPLVRPL